MGHNISRVQNSAEVDLACKLYRSFKNKNSVWTVFGVPLLVPFLLKECPLVVGFYTEPCIQQDSIDFQEEQL